MKTFLFLPLFLLLAGTAAQAQKTPLPLIPYPFEVYQMEGSYPVKSKMSVYMQIPDHEWAGLFTYFKNEMQRQFNVQLIAEKDPKKADIKFMIQRMRTSGGLAYQMEIGKDGVDISCNFPESGFHSIQTFLQLMPIDPSAKKELPYVKIFDKPRFDYRGMHLDVCRHFFPVSFVKKYIDWLAYHKLNVFHWHLTEDQGWRIEIKKYPKLTTIGSWRNGTIIGRYPGTGNDNMRYGGFYTQQEIKEVVAYAAARFIDVIPELEMPGHSSAAIAAYPWLSCFPSKPTPIPPNMISKKSVEEQKKGRIKLVQETWGVFDDVYCAGNDSTFMFLQNVIDELIPLFPSKYFHIGGDESPKTHWKICPKCQKRIKDLGLKDEHELQSYFVQRIEKYLNSKGKTLIGWDEILEGGLAPNAVVMSWRGIQGGIDAAKQNHKVIMTPGTPMYFDHTQSENEDSVTIGGYNPIEIVYSYEPVPTALNEEQGKMVIGAQANLWTEYIGNPKKAEYMVFPRIAALSELLWADSSNKDWDGFQKRLVQQFNRYDRWGVNYSKAYYELKGTVLPSADYKGVLWKIDSKFGNPVSMSFNKADSSWTYMQPQLINQNTTATARMTVNGKSVGIEQQFHFNLATGKKISLVNQASTSYPGDGPFTLVNGVINTKGMNRSKEFLGFSGANCEAIIDLGATTQVQSVTINAFNQTSSWIWRPLSAEAFISQDGSNWTSVKLGDDFEADPSGNGKGKMSLSFAPVSARYIKVVVTNWGTIPDGNPGEGKKAWLFVDEIEIR